LDVGSVQFFLGLGRHAAKLHDLLLNRVLENPLLNFELLHHVIVIELGFLVIKFVHEIHIVKHLAFDSFFHKVIITSLFLFLELVSQGGVHLFKHFAYIVMEFVHSHIAVTLVVHLLHRVFV